MPPPAVVGDGHRLDEGRGTFRRVLREERLATHSLGEALQRHRRCPFAAMKGSATAMRYSASSRLVIPTSGQSTRSGFEMPTSRSPSGPGTVSVMRGDAMTRR